MVTETGDKRTTAKSCLEPMGETRTNVVEEKLKRRNRKNRRGGKGKRNLENKNNTNFGIFATNAAGISSKMESFKSAIKALHPKVFMVQECKLSHKKSLKIADFEIFEHKRKDNGGGLALGVHNTLEPYEINDDEENEHSILVVEECEQK